jgi:hypothetical protein
MTMPSRKLFNAAELRSFRSIPKSPNAEVALRKELAGMHARKVKQLAGAFLGWVSREAQLELVRRTISTARDFIRQPESNLGRNTNRQTNRDLVESSHDE